MSKISVIVPVYNTDTGYLSTCIDSILGQEMKDGSLELILINDGSVNNAPTICAMAAKRDPRVIYISRGNEGVSVARNAGLDAATGDYVLFVDSDDFLSPGLLSRLLERMDSEDTDILFFGYCTCYKNRELVRIVKNSDPALFTPEVLQLSILNANPRLGPLEVGAPWGKLIRRSIIEKAHHRYTPGLKKGQDTVFTLGLLEQCHTLAYEPIAGYHYRVSGASISHRFSPDMIAIMERTLHAYASFIEEYDKGTIFRQALLNKYYRVLTGEYLDLYFIHRDNPASEAELMKEYRELTEKEPYKSAIDSLRSDTLTGEDKLVYALVRKRKIKALWAYHKALSFAKHLIVRSYE